MTPVDGLRRNNWMLFQIRHAPALSPPVKWGTALQAARRHMPLKPKAHMDLCDVVRRLCDVCETSHFWFYGYLAFASLLLL